MGTFESDLVSYSLCWNNNLIFLKYFKFIGSFKSLCHVKESRNQSLQSSLPHNVSILLLVSFVLEVDKMISRMIICSKFFYIDCFKILSYFIKLNRFQYTNCLKFE